MQDSIAAMKSLRHENDRLREQIEHMNTTILSDPSPRREIECAAADFGVQTDLLDSHRVADLLRENAALASRIARLEASTLQRELEALLAERGELSAALRESRAQQKRESQAVRREAAALTARLRRSEGECAALRERADEARADAAARDADGAALRRELQAQFAELQEVKRKLAAEAAQSEALRSQLSKALSVAFFVSETEREIGMLQSPACAALVDIRARVGAIREDLDALRRCVGAWNMRKARVRWAAELEKRVAAERRRTASIEAGGREFTALKASHTKALKLIGEYHRRICLLTDPHNAGARRLEDMDF
jgi:chromosome segregation ATPase